MANYTIKHKPAPIRRQPVRTNLVRQVVQSGKPARVGRVSQRLRRPVDRIQKAKKTAVNQRAVAEKDKELSLKRNVVRRRQQENQKILKGKPVLNRPVVINPGVKAGRRNPRKLERVGRGNLRHSIRSAQRQKVLRAHVNKIKEIKGTGQGKVLVILACGPSVNEVDFTPLKGHPYIDIMCINKPNKQVWPSTYWSFCDLSQYNRNKEYWKDYNGIIWNSQSVRVQHPKQYMVRNRSGQGWSRDLTMGYYISRTTTYASMQVALWLGYTKVYIFGCDMGAVGGKLHYYGKNPDVDDGNRLKRFSREAEAYNYAAANLSEPERKRFYFCSSYNKFPFVNRFNKMDHKKAVPLILEYATRLAKK